MFQRVKSLIYVKNSKQNITSFNTNIKYFSTVYDLLQKRSDLS